MPGSVLIRGAAIVAAAVLVVGAPTGAATAAPAPAVVTPAQAGVLSAPARAQVGPVTLTAQFSPAVAMRPVRFEAKTSSGWVTLTTGRETNLGVSSEVVRATGAGTYVVRAVAEAQGGRRAVATPTHRVTISAAGPSRNGTFTRLDNPGVVSADGRYEAYSVLEGNALELRYVDRTTGTVTVILPARVDGATPESISGDGSVVVFSARANRVVPEDTDDCFSRLGYPCTRYYLWSRDTQKITQVTRGSGGSFDARISLDGSTVVFASESTTLIPGDQPPGQSQLYSYAVAGGRLTRLTSGNGYVARPAPSSDGRVVVFESGSTDLVPPGSGEEPAGGTFVLDRTSGMISRLSPAYENGTRPDLSDDGTRATYLADGRVHVVDRGAGTTRTLADPGIVVQRASISGDGRWVVASGYRDVSGETPPEAAVVYDLDHPAAPTTIASVPSGQRVSVGDVVGSTYAPLQVLDGDVTESSLYTFGSSSATASAARFRPLSRATLRRPATSSVSSPGQAGVLTPPSYTKIGEVPVGDVVVEARFDPPVGGRSVAIQARKGKGWVTLATARQSAAGAVTATVRATGAGTYVLRALAAPTGTRAAVATPAVTVRVVAR